MLDAFINAESKGLSLHESYEAGTSAFMKRHSNYSKEEAAGISVDMLLAYRWNHIVTRKEK